MTLFVKTEQVPSAILELVKARIIANRNRSRQQQAAVQQPLKTPRRRYYNPEAADRRSEPGAVHNPVRGWLLVPTSQDLTAITRGTSSFSFDRDNAESRSTEGPRRSGAWAGRQQSYEPSEEGRPFVTASSTAATSIRNGPVAREFTFECLIQMWPDVTFEIGEDVASVERKVKITFGEEWLSILFDVEWGFKGFNSVEYTPASFYEEFGVRAFGFGDRQIAELSYGAIKASGTVAPLMEEDANFEDPEVYARSLGRDYVHAAIVGRPEPVPPGSNQTGQAVDFYTSGELIGTARNVPPLFRGEAERISCKIEAEYRDNTLGLAHSPRVHGIRYIERALYLGAPSAAVSPSEGPVYTEAPEGLERVFTPPDVINRLE